MFQRSFRTARIAAALMLAAAAGPDIAFAQQDQAPAADDQAVTLNLESADIRALINTISEITGRVFVVDPRVRGEVTVISGAGVPREAIYDVFLSILSVYGFAAIPSGDLIKIVPVGLAKQQGGDVALETERRPLDEFVTAVIPLTHGDAASLVAAIRPLLSNDAHLAAHQASNVLIAADSAGNIDRIIDLIRRVDVPAPSDDFELIRLMHAPADAIVNMLNEIARLSMNPNQPQAATPVVADVRTNSILLGGAPADKLRYRTLIASLDIDVPEDATIEVIYLNYATAEDLVPVIEQIFGSGASAVQQQPGQAAPQQQGPVRVQADVNTNALIIQGSPEQMRRMQRVIEQLDRRRSQVLVEGVIAEVSSTAADELGIQWRTGTPRDGVSVGGSLPGSLAPPAMGAFEDNSGQFFGNGFTLGYFSGGNIRALIRALSSDQYTNVLSTPTLVTLENAEAEIVVGQNVPFITGQFTNTATTPDNPFQTIERQDVGVILKVKPQINEGDTVTLEIEQEVSSIDLATTGADLITNERSITTTVLVDDGEMVVLGGLISDELRENENKIPFLGDIPLLGTLFKNARADAEKTNLMVFLRPTIIRSPETSSRIAKNGMDDVRQKQLEQEARPRGLYPRPKGPVLEEFDGLLE
jgi:general secretion pathway protein D